MVRKNKIITGLKEAVQYARGDHTLGTSRRAFVPKPIDVRAIRQQQGLTQEAFASTYGFPVSTLKNWEQGHRAPTGPSRTLLLVIEKRPQAVLEALEEAQGA